MSSTLGQTIREARKARGLTQEQLATLVHVSRQTVSHWENGRAEPAYDMLKALADTLEIDPAQLFSEEEIIPATPVLPEPDTVAPCTADMHSAPTASGASFTGKLSVHLIGTFFAALLALALCTAGFIRLRGAYSLRWHMQQSSVPADAPHVLLYTRESPIPKKGAGSQGMWEFPLFFSEQNGQAFEVTGLRLSWFRKNGTQHTEVITAGEFAAHTGSTVIGPNEIRMITIGKPTHYGFTHFACSLTGTDTDGQEYVFRLAVPLE